LYLVDKFREERRERVRGERERVSKIKMGKEKQRIKKENNTKLQLNSIS
jgi:hypothetical protein